MGKLQIRTEQRDKRDYILNPAVRKVKNKSGVIETRAYTCAECSEEYCNGRTCMDFNYDLYTRITPKDPTAKTIVAKASTDNDSGGKKSKKKSKSLDMEKGGKTKKRNRSKSPNKKYANRNKK